MDAFFQSSCSSCPSWLLELSSVVNARSGEGDCQLYRVLRGGRRTRCPSYMGGTNVGLSRPAGRSVLLVRRTSCPSPLEAVFGTASRLRYGGPAVAYGSAVNEESGCRRCRLGFNCGREPPLCTTDILSVAAGVGSRHRVAIAAWSPGRRLRLGGKRGSRVRALPIGLRSRWIFSCTTDILSVAAGGGIRHRVAIAVWRPGRRLRLGGKRGKRM